MSVAICGFDVLLRIVGGILHSPNPGRQSCNALQRRCEGS
jgi:hypothetical protein